MARTATAAVAAVPTEAAHAAVTPTMLARYTELREEIAARKKELDKLNAQIKDSLKPGEHQIGAFNVTVRERRGTIKADAFALAFPAAKPINRKFYKRVPNLTAIFKWLPAERAKAFFDTTLELNVSRVEN